MLPLTKHWHKEKQPNMHGYNGHKLEDNLSRQILSQIQRPIDDDKDKLQQQHDQECYRNLVFFHVGRHPAVTLCRLQNVQLLMLTLVNIDLFSITPNAVNPKSNTKKFIKSHRKMYRYRSTVKRLTGCINCSKNFVNDEQYFFVLENEMKHVTLNTKYIDRESPYDNAATLGK